MYFLKMNILLFILVFIDKKKFTAADIISFTFHTVLCTDSYINMYVAWYTYVCTFEYQNLRCLYVHVQDLYKYSEGHNPLVALVYIFPFFFFQILHFFFLCVSEESALVDHWQTASNLFVSLSIVLTSSHCLSSSFYVLRFQLLILEILSIPVLYPVPCWPLLLVESVWYLLFNI